MNSAISSLTFMFRTEMEEVIDMELENYTIQKVFCHKNSNKETEPGICSKTAGKKRVFFNDEEKHQIIHAKIKGFVVAVVFIFFFKYCLSEYNTHNNHECTFLPIHE